MSNSVSDIRSAQTFQFLGLFLFHSVKDTQGNIPLACVDPCRSLSRILRVNLDLTIGGTESMFVSVSW